MYREHKIPFTIPNVNHGMVTVKGLLHIKRKELLLEFDKKDGFVGILSSGIKQARIPFEELDSITFEKKFFKGVITISGKSMKILENVPGAEQGLSKLTVARKHRKKAEDAVRNARVVLSEFKLNEMDE